MSDPQPQPQPQQDQLGGFLPPTPTSLPSPAPGASSSSSSTKFFTDLPHPRARALRPGSNKEDMVREYASAKLMQVARRYVKKFSDPEPGDEATGYSCFADLCSDLDAVVNVLWLSGTRKNKNNAPHSHLPTFLPSHPGCPPHQPSQFASSNPVPLPSFANLQPASRSRSSSASPASSPNTPRPSPRTQTRPSSSSGS